jgi:uncharacterized protein
MIPLLEENREKIAEICRAHHVRRLSVFGSAVRDDFDPQRSDVDFLVEFEPGFIAGYAKNYLSLESSLNAILKRRVDVVSEEGIRNPFLRKSIDADKRGLYAA